MLQFAIRRNRSRGDRLASIPSNAAMPRPVLDRVVVIGTSGSGKSTLAHAGRRGWVAHTSSSTRSIGCPAGWRRTGLNFGAERQRGGRRANDGSLTEITSAFAIWFGPGPPPLSGSNYSFRIVFWRALRRTVVRIVTRETILNGNRETIRMALFSLDGVPSWVVRTYRLRKRKNSALLATGDYRAVPESSSSGIREMPSDFSTS